jgi:hypothetical protein
LTLVPFSFSIPGHVRHPAAGRLSVGSGPGALRGLQAGRAYRLARLAVKYGAEIRLDDLIVRLSSDCPWRDELRGSCGARFSIPFAWLWRAWHGVGRLIRRG